MATRILPQKCHPLRQRDYFTRRMLRAGLLRQLAQSQNFLWAHVTRAYAMCAYEGNGNFLKYGVDDPAVNAVSDPCPVAEATPYAKCIASFFLPANYGPSNKLKIEGRSTLSNNSAKAIGKLVFTLHHLDGTYTGTSTSTVYEGSTGSKDWSATLNTPGDGAAYQVRVWMRNDGLDISEGETPVADSDEVLNISAHYAVGESEEMGGDTPQATWQPIAHNYLGNDWSALHAALLRTLVRNTQHLWAYRPPEVCQSYLGKTYANTSTFAEVGRYHVYVAPHVTSVKGKLGVLCTHSGAGNEVRVLLDGVVKQTFTALAGGYQELTVTAFATTGGATRKITVEAKSTAAGASWGTIVEGVWFWEDDATFSLPVGTDVPLEYVPVDESELEADDAVLESAVRTFVENDTFLAANRLRFLVGDWRHRTLKRVDVDGAGSNRVSGIWDWTPGREEDFNPGHPKNITMMRNNTVADLTASTAHDGKDGIGRWDFGAVSPTWPTSNGFDSWPLASLCQAYMHGDRLGKFKADWPNGPSAAPMPIGNESGSQMIWYARARRLAPAIVTKPFDGGFSGPMAEDPFFKDRGYLQLMTAGLQAAKINVTGTYGGADVDVGWYGPTLQKQSTTGIDLEVRGRCPATSSPAPKYNPTEGNLFEIELLSCFLADAPLTQADLDAL